MKLRSLLFAFGLLVALSQASMGQTIVGSSHDFQNMTTWNSTGEICIVCHTPHKANTTVSLAPLWNHQLTTASNWILYSSATLNATMGAPDGSSKLCLSCHDGTVALENFGTTTTGTHFISNTYKTGTDLSNDHPVSFTYNTALATTDHGLYDPSVGLSGLGGTINGDMLAAGKLQCSSCHDVHNSAGVTHLLVKDNAGSALCLTCHKK
jgi:predicted CXXCH cytochrome family protein